MWVDNRILEAAHQSGEDEISLSTLGRNYIIDFTNMQQVSCLLTQEVFVFSQPSVPLPSPSLTFSLPYLLPPYLPLSLPSSPFTFPFPLPPPSLTFSLPYLPLPYFSLPYLPLSLLSSPFTFPFPLPPPSLTFSLPYLPLSLLDDLTVDEELRLNLRVFQFSEVQ